MNGAQWYWLAISVAALLMVFGNANSGPLDDPMQDLRYCGLPVKRDMDGSISRRTDVLRAFRILYPCPSTGHAKGACPGWNIDHPLPLLHGGCDAVYNLQWLPVVIKRCAEWYCKDRWELDVYKRTPSSILNNPQRSKP